MKLITMDCSRADSQDLDEQVVLGLMFTFKEEGDVVAWRNEEENVSIAVTCRTDFIRISVSSLIQFDRDKVVTRLKEEFKEPNNESIRESSVDPGLFIHYLEWDREEFKELEQITKNNSEGVSATYQ